jgi:hypothetical protein
MKRRDLPLPVTLATRNLLAANLDSAEWEIRRNRAALEADGAGLSATQAAGILANLATVNKGLRYLGSAMQSRLPDNELY